MKMNRIRKLFVSVAMIFAFAITGCVQGEPSYTKTNLDLLNEKIGELALVGEESLYGASQSVKDQYNTVVEKVTVQVEKALKKADINDKELGKLLNLSFEFNSEAGSVTTTTALLGTIIDEINETGVSNTKISKFVWNLFVAGKTVISETSTELFEEFYLSKVNLLASYNDVLSCLTEKDFVNTFTALLDSATLELKYTAAIQDIFFFDYEKPSKNEYKALIAEAKNYATKSNAIWTDSVITSVVAISKKVVTVFYADTLTVAEAKAVNSTLDSLVTYVRIYRKVDLAILNAFDDGMIDIVLDDDPSISQKVIVLCKLLNAAINGTGLTKDIILNFPLLPYSDYSIDEEVLTIIFNEAPKFKNTPYTAEIDYSNPLVNLLVSNLGY